MEGLIRLFTEQKRSNVVDIQEMVDYVERMSPEQLSTVLVYLMSILLIVGRIDPFTDSNQTSVRAAAVVGRAIYDGLEEACEKYLGMALSTALLKVLANPEISASVLQAKPEDTYSTNIVIN